MDFLYLDSVFQVLICTRCQYAIVPGTLAEHLRTLHKKEVSKAELKTCIEFWKDQPIQAAKAIQQLELPANTPPIPNLALFHNGILCRLCAKRPFVCSGKTISYMQTHLRTVHAWKSNCKGGRPPKASVAKATGFAVVTASPVSYQTFHRSNFNCFFQVTPPPSLLPPPPTPTTTTLEAQVEMQLAQKLQAATAAAGSVLQPPAEPSPWLQTTEWVRYLQGYSLPAAVELIALPHPSQPEPDLEALLESFSCVIEQARDSILQGKVNAFDQQRINSFLRTGSRTSKASDRPLAYKLKENTYTKYKGTWKQLLCFVYRMVYRGQQPALHCLLTDVQTAALDQVV